MTIIPKKQIYIRVDGTSQIGLGHLVRCLALAQMLKEKFKIVFVCKKVPETFVNDIKETEFDFIKISKEQEYFSLLNQENIAVLDGYHFNTKYQRNIKETKCKLVCIDDLHDKKFYADLVINHAPGVTPKSYEAQSYTRFALGIDYALLRPEFLEAAKKGKVGNGNETVFVCFGGSDIMNLTSNILIEVQKNSHIKRIIVVTGTAFRYSNKLQELVKTDSRIRHFHNIQAIKMLALMKESDFAIVPSSSILFEVLAAGCKVSAGYYVDNQKDIYEGFKSLNAFCDLKKFEDVGKITDYLSQNDIMVTPNLIDGYSNERMLKRFINL